MANSKSKNPTNTSNTSDDQFVDVLYQKLGENWFAFSLIDDEMFMTPISEDKITEIRNDHSVVNHNEAA